MRIDVKMPDLSAAEGADILLRRWFIPEGAPGKRGEPLLKIEIDKATAEVESLATGIVAEILARPDVKIAVGQVIARIEVDP